VHPCGCIGDRLEYRNCCSSQDKGRIQQNVRLYGIDTPELKPKRSNFATEEGRQVEIQRGKSSRQYLIDTVRESNFDDIVLMQNMPVRSETSSSSTFSRKRKVVVNGQTGKYGRPLVNLYTMEKRWCSRCLSFMSCRNWECVYLRNMYSTPYSDVHADDRMCDDTCPCCAACMYRLATCVTTCPCEPKRGVFINELMINDGHAVEYFGGTKNVS